MNGTTARIMPGKLVTLCVLTLVLFATFTQLGLAQEQENGGKTVVAKTGGEQHWKRNCQSKEDGDEDCQISQQVLTKDTGERVLVVIVQKSTDGETPEMLIGFPLRIFLPVGAILQIDLNVPKEVDFQFCDQRACYANFMVNEDMLELLMKGTVLNVTFENLLRKPITVPVTLIGFTFAFKSLP